jgi:hypothetical protein
MLRPVVPSVLLLLTLPTVAAPVGIALPGETPESVLTVCSEKCDYTSIQAAVDAAEPGGTILLGPETFYENVVTDRPLTIRGAGAERTVIDGMFADRVITYGGDLHLVDLTITHGFTRSTGGGISGTGHLTIENCHVVDNEAWNSNAAASAFGGGVAGRGLTRITGSLIADNRARDFGGGVFALDRLEIVDSSIVNNSAAHGGGVGDFDVGTVRIERSLIAQNQAREYGGGILAATTGSALEILNSTVTGNRATLGGGGIMVFFFRGVIVKNCTISDNSPNGIHFYQAEARVRIDHSVVAGNEYSQCSGLAGILESNGYNMASDFSCGLDRPSDQEGVEPILLPLGDYGGGTLTCPLHPDSPAIDAGGDTCLPTDQRGFPRPFDGDFDGDPKCDIGAFELGIRGEAKIIGSLHDLIFQLEGADHGLVEHLQAAMQVLEDDDSSNDADAVRALLGFIQDVEAHRGFAIGQDQADKLVGSAKEIVASLYGRE